MFLAAVLIVLIMLHNNLSGILPQGSYLACGCGCCGGSGTPIKECLYRSKGDDLQKIIEQDEIQKKSPLCNVVGCSRGVEYRYCD